MGFKQMILDWLEWQKAKRWAKVHHPAWLELATSEKVSSYTRLVYRDKIMNAYRGAEYV